MSAIEEVYEKYKHLDKCLSDPEWCNAGIGAIYPIAGELWRAVKEARENPCEENGCTDIENCDEICQHSRIYSPVQMQQAIAQATAAENKRLIWSLEELLAWVRENHMDQQDIRDHIDLMLGKYRQELELRRPEPKEREPE